jgi:hypothetical protein
MRRGPSLLALVLLALAPGVAGAAAPTRPAGLRD